MKYSRLFVAALVAVVAALATSTFISLAADCAKTVVTETEIARQAEDTPPTKNWVLYTRNAGTGTFRVGPATPPSGVGSLETVTPTGADKVTLFNFDHVGTSLADIDKMSYATYRASGASPNQVPAINIQVDINGGTLNPGEFTTLVFEPVYNTAQGAVQDGVWQTWDAYNGGNAIWWSSRAIPGVCAADCFVTWDTIIAANPNATIVGGFGINQGSGNPALTASSDVLTIGSGGECITYDFEPYKVATTASQCKNGGYNSVKRADGSSFKNQGDCIQYVNTGK
ncbi:MAG TPA: hypothetical protein VJT74_00030 [Pyrinomonadaceae bacterium]|nr:hypothetical protein [Pyrinomonadaceae bacterium]